MMAFGHCMLEGHVDLMFDLLYTGPKITISAIAQRIFIRFSLDLIYIVACQGGGCPVKTLALNPLVHLERWTIPSTMTLVFLLDILQ